jgi:anaerobic selenocysteine-containing dehydrogenase
MDKVTRLATCPFDCPGACALEVEVSGEQLVSIRGRRDHPFTQGIICGKVASYNEIQDGPRVLVPMLRDGAKGDGRFRESTWEEALDQVATRLTAICEEHGPEAVLPFYYGGTMGIVQQKAIERLAGRAGFSRLGRSLCSSTTDLAWKAGVGAVIGPAPQEVAQSDLVILWGINAVSTHVNFMTFVKRARRQGARLIVIDPYRTRTARLADLHLQVRPGTDGALACALMSELIRHGAADRTYLERLSDFDAEMEAHLRERTPDWAAPITGLSASVIRNLAHTYATAERPFIRVGIGMSRQRNGAVNLHAISCLPTVKGVWPRVGGGALLGTDDAFAKLDDSAVRLPKWQDPRTRLLDMSQLGRWLTDEKLRPPVSALLVFNANPAGSCPDLVRVTRGLRRDDLFTVVHEQVMSDTARFADVLLPATTFLEHADLYRSYGQTTLQLAERILVPRGQARCNHDVVNDLAHRLGYNDEPFSRDTQQTIDAVLRDSGLPERAAFPEQGYIDLLPDEQTRHFRNGFPQPDRRFHFYPRWSDPAMPERPDHWPVNVRDQVDRAARFPLDFMAPPAHDVLNTTFTGTQRAARHHGPPCLLIHPTDAGERGIHQGDRVAVFNELARLTMTARLTDEVPPGLCLCESNHRAASFPEGVSLNALAHDHLSAPGGSPAFHDNRVQVEVLPAAE